MGPENKNPKKKFRILIFKCAKLEFCKKKLLVKQIFFFFTTPLCLDEMIYESFRFGFQF